MKPYSENSAIFSQIYNSDIQSQVQTSNFFQNLSQWKPNSAKFSHISAIFSHIQPEFPNSARFSHIQPEKRPIFTSVLSWRRPLSGHNVTTRTRLDGWKLQGRRIQAICNYFTTSVGSTKASFVNGFYMPFYMFITWAIM